MRYLITKNNIPYDYTYSNVIGFINTTQRDEYINNKLMDGKDYRIEMSNQPEVSTQMINSLGDGTIEIKWDGSKEELYKKNYIILQESNVVSEPSFYFIKNISPIENNNIYELELQKDYFMNNVNIFDRLTKLELKEGHINDANLLDMEFDGGYKKAFTLEPLERDYDFNAAHPGKDINLLDNQWVYVFIKSTGETNNIPLFRLNGQLQPYRILIAPLKDIIVEDNSEIKTVISNVNERWESVNYFHNEEKNADDNDIRGNQDQLERERTSDVLNEPTKEKGNIKISFNYNKTDMNSVNKVVEIPFDKLELYKDNWFPIYLGNNESEYNQLNNQLWNTTDKTKPANTSDSEFWNVVAFEIKYDTFLKKFKTRALKRDRTPNTTLYALKAKAHGGWYRDWTFFIPNDWNRIFEWGNSRFDGDPRNIDALPTGNQNIKWPYMCNETGSFTLVSYTTDWNRPLNWNFTIKEVYQGEDTGKENLTWTLSSLMTYINSQANVVDGNKDELIGAKISSFNPLELDKNGFPTNIKLKDSTTKPNWPDDWKNTGLYELFEMNTDNIATLNTYDLSKYKDKSWLKGINNYSIMIENNKEFDIKPELIYGDGKFVHQVIPTPNEWTERIVWENDIHNTDYEFDNTKEIIFATNNFNQYQANNPDNFRMAKLNAGVDMITGIMSGAGTSATAMALGNMGGALAGSKQIGGSVMSVMNFKANIANMKNQPLISSGTGSAYSDMYINKNGFGLSIVEWQYLTPQTPSLIESVIRNGIELPYNYICNYKAIKRPEFNYIKIHNGLEALSFVDMTFSEKEVVATVLEKGVRVWYNPDNYLNFDVDNNSLFRRDMVNFINWDETKKSE